MTAERVIQRKKKRSARVRRYPSTTISFRDMDREVEAARDLVRDQLDLDHARPRTRDQCDPCEVCQIARDGAVAITADLELACGHRGDEIIWHSRPCVMSSCRHGNYLEVTDVGSILLLHADVEPEEMDPEVSCSIDVAIGGDHTLDVIGRALGVSRERARQLEVLAKRHLRAGLGGAWIRDADGFEHPEGFVEPPSE